MAKSIISFEVTNLLSNKGFLNFFLSEHGLEIIDLRSKGGTIWIVGGRDLAPIIDLLKPHGFHFKYLENGVEVTGHHSACFLVS